MRYAVNELHVCDLRLESVPLRPEHGNLCTGGIRRTIVVDSIALKVELWCVCGHVSRCIKVNPRQKAIPTRHNCQPFGSAVSKPRTVFYRGFHYLH